VQFALTVPVLEDKLLQVAVTQILMAIYEMDFLPCSYGYRPGLSAHDALKTLTRELQFSGHNFVVEADIQGFFDNICVRQKSCSVRRSLGGTSQDF
jgi:retron-type reverse transcriptase